MNELSFSLHKFYNLGLWLMRLEMIINHNVRLN